MTPNDGRKSEDEAPTAGTKSPLPGPTLPKGGGAIRGIGEKFSANPATGGGSLSVPIFTSPGRGGFHPELTLQYDSGKGNGPFGMGWSLSVPRITRKTDKGLPRYLDAQESDTFILSGSEDLVPAFRATNERDTLSGVSDPQTGEICDVLRYRPRVESAYARIERWTPRSGGVAYWRSITKDNIASVYGRSPNARIADPEHTRRVFSWLLEETRDGKGNIIGYEYKLEDQQSLDLAVGWEQPRPVANAYLKRISYGNETPDAAGNWLFQVLFDYGEHDTNEPVSGPLGVWRGRQDPFSDFRSTFEVRTYRLCRRILMLHDFAELGDGWTVVRSTELTYQENPISTYLQAVTQRGWLRNADGSYDQSLALPPIGLGYSQPKLEPEIHDVDPASLANLPIGIDGRAYQLLDLDSEGLPGILTQQADAFFYKRNDGDGQFGSITRLETRPSVAEIGSGVQQITDVDGSGDKFLVQLGRQPQGYFERQDNSWGNFRPFKSLPNLDWSAPGLKYLDLDGDGLPDILKPEGNLFRWWGSLGRNGYGEEHRVPQPRDDEKGPAVVWSDPQQAIVIADMTGDGLPDLVRITNGSVCYWPNRGFGCFGAKVTMRNAPRFDRPDAFNPAFLRLADIDGSGTADLIYLADGAARIWLNQSGNGYAGEERTAFPAPVGASVDVSDLLGKGTACLVWSSPLPRNQGRQMRYVDLMSGIKPHLLVSIDNQLGATTKIEYKPSTEYYLEDRKSGRPWVTRLPFPMHVVSRVETNDAVTGTKLVTTYRYRHGHYDGIEREFGGFGFVEQEDTETAQAGTAPPEAYTPPRRTCSWFHTGAFFDAETISTQYKGEYNADFPQLVPDSVISPPNLAPEEAREAARALRGHLLRQEIFGLDGSPLESHPYAVTESNFEVKRLQPQASNRYAAFCVHPRETLTAHTERKAADPRLEHEVTLAVDDFGNVQESVHIGYRRQTAADDQLQGRTLATYAQRAFDYLTEAADYYRVDLLRESRTYELVALKRPLNNGVYSHSEIGDLIAQINGSPTAMPPIPPSEIDFADRLLPSNPARRLFERTKHLYLGDQPGDKKVLALGLPVETRRAALTPTLVDNVYRAVAPDPNTRRQMLIDNQYVDEDALWWALSGQTDYGAFYQPKQFTDPFGNLSTLDYDNHSLLLMSAKKGVGTSYATTIGVQNDYRVIAPAIITDANGNRSRVAFDALGRVTTTWLMGKQGEQIGDDDAHPSTQLEYHLETIPAYVRLKKREEHYYADPSNQKLQRAYAYSDGLGREVLTKKQAEPDESGSERWVGTGRTVFDNKGNPARKYEPYFSTTPGYEAVIQGVSDLLHYDPLDRVVSTDHPNGSYSRVELDAWTQTTYDENDTVGEPGNAWFAKFSTGTLEQQDAAQKALTHTNTPTTIFFDPLGRAVITQHHNGPAPDGTPILFTTTVDLDIQGNQRAVIDARSVTVTTHLFDLLGRRLFTHSVDAGDSTLLLDVLGAQVLEWNPNSIHIERDYDPLRRPQRVWVTDNGPRRLAERTFYGESLSDGAVRNLRGRIFRQLDGAGRVTHEQYDFKGNLVLTRRQLTTRFDQLLDWPELAEPTDTTTDEQVPGLDTESLSTTTEYDALNRITTLRLPSGELDSNQNPLGDHTALPTYNRAGLLDAMSVQFAGSTATTPFVTGIDYNEKGQRTKSAYGNGAVTVYGYERDTFRLSSIETFKTENTTKPDLQALKYTYDPVGNVTTNTDAAQETYFVGNSKVSPTTKYTYDAIYRLTNAQGREHSGQAGMDQTSTPDGVPFPSPNDPQAMRNYVQNYEYDAVGNFLSIVHQAFQGPTPVGWTRTYDTDTASNRLLSSRVGARPTVTYLHDLAGNMTNMQSGSLPTMDWDYRNQLLHAVAGSGEAYFTYDAGGQRVRKVLVNGNTIKERIYLGTYEIYRERAAMTGTIRLERRTLHVNDDKRRMVLVELLTVGTPATASSINDGPGQLIRYQLDNHLGSAVLELNGSGQLLSYEEYHPFGTTAYRATDSVLDSNPKRYAFTGKERDEETGLYYFGARYCAPWLGRWISVDPVSHSEAESRYAFCAGNPITKVDPDGADTVDVNSDIQSARSIAIAKGNETVNALWPKELVGPGSLVLQRFKDPSGIQHQVKLNLTLDPTARSPITTSATIRTKEGVLHQSNMILPVPALPQERTPFYARELFHELLHVGLSRDASLPAGAPTSGAFKEYNRLFQAVQSGELAGDRSAFEKLPNFSRAEAIQMAVEEFYVTRVVGRAFEGKAPSAGELAKKYSAKIADTATGIRLQSWMRDPARVSGARGIVAAYEKELTTLFSHLEQLEAKPPPGTSPSPTPNLRRPPDLGAH